MHDPFIALYLNFTTENLSSVWSHYYRSWIRLYTLILSFVNVSR